jgi:hypothetical protein
MRFLKLFSLFLLFFFFSLSIIFAKTVVEAEIDKTKIATDESITYKFTITVDSKDKVLKPTFPKFEGFSILSQAQSSTVSFGNKGTQSMLLYVFILAPLKTGKLEIEPGKVKIEGKEYLSDGFQVEVTPGKTQSQEPGPQIPPQPEEDQLEPESPQITL